MRRIASKLDSSVRSWWRYAYPLDFILLITFCLLPRLSFANQLLPRDIFPTQQEAKLWSEISVDLHEIRARIVNENRTHYPCATNAVAYSQCVNMLLAMTHYHEKKLILLTPYEALRGRSVVATFGDLRLVEAPEFQRPTHQGELLTLLKERRLNITRVYEQTRNPGFDIEEFFAWVEVEVLLQPNNVHRQTEIIVAALNAWYRAADPYARLIPEAEVRKDVKTQSYGELKASLSLQILPPQMNRIRSVPPGTESIGYLHLHDFHDMAGPVRDSIARLLSNKIGGLIIDLRGNQGSYLADMHLILDYFVENRRSVTEPKGTLLFFTKPRNSRNPDERDSYYSQRPDILDGLPIVVITDYTVASSAEIFAGSLKFLGRAWILGDNTFGKGSMLDLIPTFSQKALLAHTSYMMYLPDESTPHIWGITPDFLVDPTPHPRSVNVHENLEFADKAPIVEYRRSAKSFINSCRDRLKSREDWALNYSLTDGFYDSKTKEAFIALQCIINHNQ